MFGRTIQISIAKDNGRSTEFDAKRTYPDKQRCFECGEEGHLSYKCPINVLGTREPPQIKGNKKSNRAATSQFSEVEDARDTGVENVIVDSFKIFVT